MKEWFYIFVISLASKLNYCVVILKPAILISFSFRYTCKTIDIASPVASPKPAEWKFVNAAGSPWIELYCTLNVEFNIGLSDSESSSSLRQQLEVQLQSFISCTHWYLKLDWFLKTGISIYSKAVKESLCLIDNKLLSDSDLLESSKEKGKKKQNQASSEERIKTVNIQVLIPEVIFLFLWNVNWY